jgi:nucleotide-binding universal stress UspA family protein
MPVNQIIFFQKEKINFNNLRLVKKITQKLQKKLILVFVDIPQEEKEKAVLELSSNGIEYSIRNQLEEPEITEEIKKEKPDLLVLTREKLSPFEHIFKVTFSEKLVKEFENIDILLLQEDTDKIQKILINIDKETSTPFYIKSAYEFAKKLQVEFKLITSFFESYYEYSLMKTHPEEEAKQIVGDLLKEHIEAVKEKLAQALEGNKAELIVIKGDPKKEIPYYARKHKFDLLMINENIEDRDSYVENSEMSVGIFKDQNTKGE